ncbi:MAG: hypothetical protein ACRDCH_02280 [Metamycoplasmataceae bacterium]
MKTINYKYDSQQKKLTFTWGEDGELEIFIEQNKGLEIDKLYDFIISNITEINFENQTNETEKKNNESVPYLASLEIVEALKEETNKIKEEFDKINNL